MRKFITSVLFLLAITVHAQQIGPDEAATIASEFLNSPSLQLTKAKRIGVKRARTVLEVSDDQPCPYYIFNGEGDQGFVIVAGDKRAKKILGYSDTGNFDFDNLPPQLAAMLDQYAEQIASLPASAATDPSWSASARISTDNGGVLLETANWGQGYPYNMNCPIVDGVQAPTGCVATAMAIIMKYYNWPEKGRSFNDVIIDGITTRIDFSQYTFNYNSMPLSYNIDSESEQYNDISSLMYAIGRSVYMDYGVVESGAYFQIVSHQLQEKFSYSPNCEFLMGKDYSWEEWVDIILNELNNKRPILYAGYAGESPTKHAFVCDGYSNEGLFHINWGWNGVDNGYFALDEIIYSYEPSMIINITPDVSGEVYARPYILHDDIYTLFEEADCINVSRPFISQNVPFDIGSPCIRTPYGFDGELGFALIDDAGKIKEVLGTHKIYAAGWHPYLAYGEGCDFQLSGIVVSEAVEKTDKIQLIARESENDDWRPVLGCATIPSSISVENCNNKMSEIKVETDSYFIIETGDPQTGNWSPITESSFTRLFGSHLQFYCYIKEGVPNGYGIISVTGKGAYDDNNSYVCSSENEPLGFAFRAIDNYTMTGTYYEYTDPLKLEIETAGTLSTLISVDEAHKVGDLTLSGNINAFDIWYIRENMKGLYHLDLNATTIKGIETPDVFIHNFPVSEFQPDNAMPDWALESLSLLEDVVLPSNLKHLQSYSLSGLKISSITLPSSIESFGINNFFVSSLLDEIVNLNPTPAPIMECNFTGTKCPESGCLIVPEESLSAYKEAPVWKDFKNIYALGTILPKAIEIQPGTAMIEITKSQKMQVAFLPEDTDIKDLRWESDNELIVSVSDDGVITGINYGSANVTAYTVNNRFTSCLVTVIPLRVQEITLNESDINLYVGQSLQFSAVVVPEGAFNKVIEWSSSNPEVATVDQYGYVSAVAEGTTTIIAKAIDGSGVSASCNVVVKSVLIESLAVTPESWNGTIGETFQIMATVMPEYATDRTLVWSTSDETVAIVNDTGVVSVLKAGSCVITVSTVDGSNLTDECIITCAVGIGSMFADDVKVDVYNVNGVLLKRGCGKAELKSLAPGVYIVRSNYGTKTIVIY